MRFATSPLVVAVALGLLGRAALEEEEEAPTEDLSGFELEDVSDELDDIPCVEDVTPL